MAINVQIHDHSARISVSGCFDFKVHRDFKDAYMPLLGNAVLHEIEIEMSKVERIDSFALGMLALLNDRAKEANKSVALLNTSCAVSKILGSANFNRIFSTRHAVLLNTESRKSLSTRPWLICSGRAIEAWVAAQQKKFIGVKLPIKRYLKKQLLKVRRKFVKKRFVKKIIYSGEW